MQCARLAVQTPLHACSSAGKRCPCTDVAHATPRDMQHLGCDIKVRQTTGNIPGHGKPVRPALRCQCCRRAAAIGSSSALSCR